MYFKFLKENNILLKKLMIFFLKVIFFFHSFFVLIVSLFLFVWLFFDCFFLFFNCPTLSISLSKHSNTVRWIICGICWVSLANPTIYMNYELSQVFRQPQTGLGLGIVTCVRVRSLLKGLHFTRLWTGRRTVQCHNSVGDWIVIPNHLWKLI